MDSISQTIKILRFLIPGKKLLLQCSVTILLWVMTVILFTNIYCVMFPASSVMMTCMVLLLNAIVTFAILVVLFLRWIRSIALTSLQKIYLTSVFTQDDQWIFRFTMNLSHDAYLITVTMPDDQVYCSSFVPDYVYHYCLSQAFNYYAKENDPPAR